MKSKQRKIDLVVISDVHLGTYGCRAKELNKYLKGILPKTLVLNGDIIDIWQFSKRYWPNSHMKVVKQILNLASKGTKVYYLTGNHDETLRKFEGLQIGDIHIKNKLELDLDGKKALLFHGDVFDVVMQHSKWIAKLGAFSYDALILLNVVVNQTSRFFGRGNVSLSKKIKDNVKSAVKYINNFEDTAAQLAIQKGFDYVVCGHIHHPEDKFILGVEGGKIRYLNSGDWVENLTALEYHKKKWKCFQFQEERAKIDQEVEDLNDFTLVDFDNKKLFQKMLADFR